MTPKEKAKELLCKFSILPDGNNETVKECAIICAKEITEVYLSMHNQSPDNIHFKFYILWWKDVIEEIKKYK